MIYEIKNNVLNVKISSFGAELMSLMHGETEYLWQGDEAYWSGRAYNLFPVVCRLYGKKYTYRGKSYEMNPHGFVRESELKVTVHTESSIEFCLISDETTSNQYPFEFVYRVAFTLIENTLKISYNVQNIDTDTMIFALGGHPGFNIPLESDKKFDDYYLEFACKSPAKAVEMSETCFTLSGRAPFPLEGGTRVPLRHAMFDNDAIVLQEMCRTVSLRAKGGQCAVTLRYPKMRYLGIWHKPKSDAPYVCIEPWTSLASYDGVVDDLETKPDMERLAPSGIYENEWSITIE